jgi:integrase
MTTVGLCTGVKCSELAAMKWSDFDWQDLSVYIRRAIASGRLDEVTTEYSEAPLPLDPALAEVIFEWRRKVSFVPTRTSFLRRPSRREKALHPLEHAAQPTEPSRRKGWVRTNRLAYPAPYLPGVDNGEPLTVQKETHAARVHSDHAEIPTAEG